MKYLLKNAFVVVMGVALAGCEWGGGGDDNSWNDSTSIANFSGSYRGGNGSLVSDYSASTPTVIATPSSSGISYVLYTSENGGNTGPNRVSLSGKTQHGLVKPGSVTIIFGGVSGSAFDDGTGGMHGSYVFGPTNFPVTGGHIEYDTGVWTLQFTPPGLPVSQPITVNYSAAGAVTSGGSSSSNSGSGNSFNIYAFNVQQSGNKLKIIDNNGSVYSGSFGDVKTTGNLSAGSSGAGFVNGDQVVAPFSAAGKSASGMYVNLTGNFQGTVAGVTTVSETSGSTIIRKTSFALSERVILGTWIEDGGKTGEIRGVSPSAANVSVSSSTSTNAP